MALADTPNYPYPVSNSELISAHSLIKHFEGGYFSETVKLESGYPSSPSSPNPHVALSKVMKGREQSSSGAGAELLGGKEAGQAELKDSNVDATMIYYLLTPDSYRGRMHMNLHSSFHIHHAGRALYTLIRPPQNPGDLPTIRRVIMGPNVSQGEVTQFFVPGGWWKASEIPDEDSLLLDVPTAEASGMKERVGCLVSEVVVPGWNPDQHQFIDEEKLKSMWSGQSGWETFTRYIQAPEGYEYPDK